MDIGERLKKILKHNRITAPEFAEAVGVSVGMVYKYYKMKDPDYSNLTKWSEILKVPIIAFTNDFQYRLAVDDLTDEERQEIEIEREKVLGKGGEKIMVDLGKELRDAIKAKNHKIENLMRYIGKLELLLQQNGIDYSELNDPKKIWPIPGGENNEPNNNGGKTKAV